MRRRPAQVDGKVRIEQRYFVNAVSRDQLSEFIDNALGGETH